MICLARTLRSVSFHCFDFVLRYFLFNNFLLLFAMYKLNALIRYNGDWACCCYCCSYWCISSTKLQIKFERWIIFNFVSVYDRTPFSFFIIYFVIISIQKRANERTSKRTRMIRIFVTINEYCFHSFVLFFYFGIFWYRNGRKQNSDYLRKKKKKKKKNVKCYLKYI